MAHRRWLNRLSQRLPLPQRLLFRLANRAQNQGQIQQAIDLLEQYLERWPDQRYGRQRLMDLYYQLGCWPDLERHAEYWLNREPKAERVWQMWLESLLGQRKFAAALNAYEASLTDGFLAREAIGQGVAQLAAQLVSDRDWPLAAQAYDLALQAVGDRTDWQVARLQALVEAQDWPTAATVARAILAGNAQPDGTMGKTSGSPWAAAQSYKVLGDIARRSQDNLAAAIAYRRAIAAGHTSVWVRIHLAEALAAVSQWRAAAQAYGQAEADAKADRARQSLADRDRPLLPRHVYQAGAAVFDHLADWPGLLAWVQGAIAHFPRDSDLLGYLARAYDGLADRPAAIATYRQALDLAAVPNPEHQAALAHLLLAQLDQATMLTGIPTATGLIGSERPERSEPALPMAISLYDQAIASRTDWPIAFYVFWAEVWADQAQRSNRSTTTTTIDQEIDQDAVDPDDRAWAAWPRAIAALETAIDRQAAESPLDRSAEHSGSADPAPDLARWSGQLGQWLRVWGEADRAIAAQQRAYDLDRRSGRAGLAWAHSLADQGQTSAAAILYWRHLTTGEPVSWPTWQAAIACFDDRPAAAIAIARQAIVHDRHDLRRYLFLAEALEAKTLVPEAVAVYSQAIDLLEAWPQNQPPQAGNPSLENPGTEPDSVQANWADLCQGLGLPESSSPQAVVTVLALRVAELEFTRQRWPRAIAAYSQAFDHWQTDRSQIDRSRTDRNGQFTNVKFTSKDYRQWATALEKTEDWLGAIACYRRAIDQFPKNTVFYQSLARLLDRDGQFAAAAEAYSHVIDLKADAPEWVYRNRIYAYLKAGQETAAIEATQAAIARIPLDAGLREQLARIRLSQGDPWGAITALWQAIALDPTLVSATIELLRQLFAVNAEAIAISLYHQASQNGLALPAYLHRQCADWLEAQGQLTAARSAFDRAIDQHPNHGRLRGALAEFLARRGDRPGAEQAFTASLALEPREASLHQAFGNYWLTVVGDRDRARACYETAQSFDPTTTLPPELTAVP